MVELFNLMNITSKVEWAKAGMAGALIGVALIVIAFIEVVDIISGRVYFKAELESHILDCMESRSSSPKSEEGGTLVSLLCMSRLMEKLVSNEGDVQNEYHETLKFAEKSLSIAFPVDWEESIKSRLDIRKSEIEEYIDKQSQEIDDKQLESDMRKKYLGRRISRRSWHCENKERLESYFKLRVLYSLVKGFLGAAGTGGTLGLFAGLVRSLSRDDSTGWGISGWEVSAYPILGTLLFGYLYGVHALLIRWRNSALSVQIMMYLISLFLIAAIVAGLTKFIVGSRINPVGHIFAVIIVLLFALILWIRSRDARNTETQRV